MSNQSSARLSRELDLIERLAQYHGRKFHDLIEQFNSVAASGSTDHDSLRLCVEAVGAMLASQDRLAHTLRELTAELRPASIKFRRAA